MLGGLPRGCSDCGGLGHAEATSLAFAIVAVARGFVLAAELSASPPAEVACREINGWWVIGSSPHTYRLPPRATTADDRNTEFAMWRVHGSKGRVGGLAAGLHGETFEG